MNINVKSKFGLRYISSKKTLTLVSLLFMIALISSPFILTYSGVSPFALGAEPVEVGTESELVAAINAAPAGEPTIINITNDITLTNTVEIPADKNITLASKSNSRFFKLLGAADKETINVKDSAELVLAGIIVTHEDGAKGSGVVVNGILKMTGGQIFNNNVTGNGGGVYNSGDFILSGGEILNNTASTQNGGGVYNTGNFNVTGGAIYGNAARWGGGVYNNGKSFRITGGDIYKNTANNDGGGVYLSTDSVMTNGNIYDNRAEFGGGVYIADNELKMTGGKIYRNTVGADGGGVYNEGNFTLTTDTSLIFNNTAPNGNGGGVYTSGIFKMDDSKIVNNTAIDGGGIYVQLPGNFTMNYGTIGNNTATRNGGGIGVGSINTLEGINIGTSAVFSNNKAATAYNRTSNHDDLYNDHIKGKTWTSPFPQGYNNYDIHYTWGTRTENPEATPTTSPTSTAAPTSTASSTPNPTSTNKPTPTPTTTGDWLDWRVIVVLALIICLIVAVLVFYLPRRGAKQVEEDLSDFTVV